MFGITPDQYPYIAIGALLGIIVVLATRKPKPHVFKRYVTEIPSKLVIEEESKE